MNNILLAVTTYNKEHWIAPCLSRIARQTVNNFDVLVYDDCSIDTDTQLIIKRYESTFMSNNINYSYIFSSVNDGIAISCNKIINYARKKGYKYITFVDGDDLVAPTYVDELYKALISCDTLVSSCNYLNKAQQRNTYDDDFYGETNIFFKISPDTYYSNDRIGALNRWGKLYDISLFDGIEYPEYTIHEDTSTTYKLLFKTDLVAMTNSILYEHKDKVPGSITYEWTKNDFILREIYLEQIYFFKDKYLSSYKTAINIYIGWLYESLKNPESKIKFKKERKWWKKELQLAIHNYRDYIHNKNGRYWDIIKQAYPVKYYYYRLLKFIFNNEDDAIYLDMCSK